MKNNTKGITLIALVISIIVLLILSGIAISMLSGENGILKKAGEAKEQNEIASEKEQISLAWTATIMQNSKNIKETLQSSLDLSNGTGKTKVYKNGSVYAVYMLDSKRLYNIDKDGAITSVDNIIMVSDSSPGVLEEIDNEFIINSIEDLVYFASSTNDGNTYSGSTVKLAKSLDFESELSYCNPETTDYNTFLGVGSDVTLFEALTNREYEGFKSIGTFSGIFDGQQNKIYNFYQNNETGCGLISSNTGTVKNLGIININLTSNQNIGGICTSSSGNMENCYVEGDINIIESGSSKYVGILVSEISNGTYKYLHSTGNLLLDVTKSPSTKFGGICGHFIRGFMERCYNIMDISCLDFIKEIGGIVGYIERGNVKECYHIGDIYNPSTDVKYVYAGGIAAMDNGNEVINNSYSIGKIFSWQAGGIAASSGDVSNCYSIGEITTSYCGGTILGMNYGKHLVHCFGRRNNDFIYTKSPDRYKLPDGELTESQITKYLSSYNTTEQGYGYGTNAVIGYKCNAFYDAEFKTQAFVDELNNLITADSNGNITETSQSVWKMDIEGINGGYPIFTWQTEKADYDFSSLIE